MSSVEAAGPLTSSGDSYWAQTRRPLPSLVFMLPLLIFYEIGVLWLGGAKADLLRNGADAWMRLALDWVGFGERYLLPLLVLVIFLGWQLFRQDHWHCSSEVLIGMLAESLLFGLCLVAISHLQDLVFQRWDGPSATPGAMFSAWRPPPAAGFRPAGPILEPLLTFVGAGVYEEVLFRLVLLPILFGVFRLMGFPVTVAAAAAALGTSFVFSVAHYLGPYGEPFDWFGFTFRAVAGLFFSI